MSLFPVFAVPELVVGNYLLTLTLTQIQLLILYIFAQRQLYIEVIS